MYSRNTRMAKSGGLANEAPIIREESAQSLPPNYRGMLYKSEQSAEIVAEGIDRLVNEDQSYSDYKKKLEESCARRNENGEKMKPVGVEKGLHRLIGGLTGGDFQAEDILIAAMMILMLNSTSEDDILMVLVLMMLL